ncbi:GTPase HflX [Glycomyces sp. TRM65418]|uniref:GTPase HflX n=1 Tax=Glycomyces sp. TRM65418 TaxID=2867006 RepID=UPI001CE699F3|nr:GTPase HflX [Glycomyces sp. TRM65418]MCC3764915.1 GTPase HflX [Glycomyces sp. TRM65418]QZD54556.1 GTPase HflX [Glycomyces sp. TRM65418]
MHEEHKRSREDFPSAESPSAGDLDLEARQALRRVSGIAATELEDVTDAEYRRLRLERVVLVGVWTEGSIDDAENSLAELAQLAETAGSEVVDGLIQRRSKPDAGTFIGSGKVQEVKDTVEALEADTVIADGELSPGQLIALEKAINVKVIDRTALILDIFAQHAKSAEGKAQVELAQLQYLLPRLRGWGDAMSRQAGGRAGSNGGVGLRGPGETKLETDRRRIRAKVAKLRRELAKLTVTRETKRDSRTRNRVPGVAIAGYTNAGKSSLLNALTGAGILVQDALFATLDTSTRRARTAEGREYTVTDTVGFVRHLPHQLVEAFRSTLEEVAEADLIVHVIDGSHPDPLGQADAVREVLAEVGAEEVPELVVVNKLDLVEPDDVLQLRSDWPDAVFVSARTGDGIDKLRDAIEQALPQPNTTLTVCIPYVRGDLVSRLRSRGEVLATEHRGDGSVITARVDEALAGELRAFVLETD